MSGRADFLFELGTEELPTAAVAELSEALEEAFRSRLAALGLEHGRLHRYATPRRLAVLVEELAATQPDQQISRRGPAISAAFDAAGEPTRAALGFARSVGAKLEELSRVETDKGAWLSFERLERGAETSTLLPELVSEAVRGLPVAKRMRWGTSTQEFARPVQWVVALYGDRLVPMSILGVAAGQLTFGHRFHAPDAIVLEKAGDYAEKLEREGYVVASWSVRRARIEAGVAALAESAGLDVDLDPSLIDEVNALVEWPVPVMGGFEEAFLIVPEEALVSVMRDHQKYFHLRDPAGRLVPRFITVSNIESRNPAAVVAGNERVIRPRLADAKFFFDKDRERRLETRLDDLASVVYQRRLGTLADKTARIRALSRPVAEAIGADPALVERAATLSRCDLTTLMVYEFPELQGIAGRYYAEADGEPDAVAQAIEDFYLPRHAGDDLPGEGVAEALAIADRIDTLTGIFGIGQPPTGDRDPFGLRRAALGLVRIAVERRVDFNLDKTLAASAAAHGDAIDAARTPAQVRAFILERMRYWYQDAGLSTAVFEAVASAAPPSLVDIDDRVRAVASFADLPEAEALAAANKRIANLLKKSAGPDASAAGHAIDPSRFEPAETSLFSALDSAREEIGPLLAARDYRSALKRLAALRGPVDRFFDEVMVMAEDPQLRANRLALLGRLKGTFMEIADVARLNG